MTVMTINKTPAQVADKLENFCSSLGKKVQLNTVKGFGVIPAVECDRRLLRQNESYTNIIFKLVCDNFQACPQHFYACLRTDNTTILNFSRATEKGK